MYIVKLFSSRHFRLFQPVWFTFETAHKLKEKIRKCEWENPEYSYMVVKSTFRKYLPVGIFNPRVRLLNDQV